nr:alkaline phosphatase family protein [Candidatus Sigynarchaeota archaeon]
MTLPEYEGNSIVNVMSSIANHFNGKNPYPSHAKIPAKLMQDVKNVVVIAIDGLGFNFFQRYFKDSALARYLAGSTTSVFPSTTAAAMTTIYTGVAPQNHGILAWFTYFKELGLIGIMPPMLTRGDRGLLIKGAAQPSQLLQIKSMFVNINARGYLLSPSEFLKKPYNLVVSEKGQQIGFGKFTDMLERVKNIVKNSPGKNLITGYWPGVDQLSHEKGTTSEETIHHATDIITELGNFLDSFVPGNPNTRIFITADHGLVDTTPNRIIQLDDHPDLKNTLTLPLCGEPRATFCYVRPRCTDAFERYIETNLSHACTLVKTEDAIAQSFFGKFEPHPRLFDRAGDYILLMKENYVLKDLLLGETRASLIGHHGGTSEDEMLVPLFIG